MRKLINSICILAGITTLMALCSCTGINKVRDMIDDTHAGPTSPSYLAVESNSGRILYSYNANARRKIGMLTNLATAAVIADWITAQDIDPCTLITVPQEATLWSTTNRLGLGVGDRLSIRDALYSTILWDDSSCAITLAYACGYRLDTNQPHRAFIAQMNQLAKQLGMLNTYFKSSHGAASSRSTAKDLALLSIYVQQKPIIQLMGSQQVATCVVLKRDGSQQNATVRNTNRLIGYNRDVDGLKASLSSEAGACLIVSARQPSVKRQDFRTGQTLTYPQNMIIVILGMKDQARYRAASSFLKDGWSKWEEWRKTYNTSNPNEFVILPKTL